MAAYKLSLEVGQRVMSYSSDDFGQGDSYSVQRATAVGPALSEWVQRLQARIDLRGALPLQENGLPPRFHRVCQVYELGPVERKLLGVLLMQVRVSFPSFRTS